MIGCQGEGQRQKTAENRHIRRFMPKAPQLVTTTTLWLNHGFASQRALALSMRAARGPGKDWRLLLSHRDMRIDILGAGDVAVQEPELEDADYAAWALELCRSAGVSALLAVRHRAVLLAAEPAFAAAGIRLLAGATTPETLALCEDKGAFTAHLAAAGLPVPRSLAVQDAAELAEALTHGFAAGTPLCVKPVNGIYGMGFWRLDPEASPFAAYANPDARRTLPHAFLAAFAAQETPRPLLVMEYLPGAETSIDCLCETGRVLMAAARVKRDGLQWISTEGASVDLARRVVALLGLHGAVNVQTRMSAAGEECVLEVNTRPSGGIAYSTAAGIDFGPAIAALMLGRPLPVQVPVRQPVAVRIADVPVMPQTPTMLPEQGIAAPGRDSIAPGGKIVANAI